MPETLRLLRSRRGVATGSNEGPPQSKPRLATRRTSDAFHPQPVKPKTSTKTKEAAETAVEPRCSSTSNSLLRVVGEGVLSLVLAAMAEAAAADDDNDSQCATSSQSFAIQGDPHFYSSAASTTDDLFHSPNSRKELSYLKLKLMIATASRLADSACAVATAFMRLGALLLALLHLAVAAVALKRDRVMRRFRSISKASNAVWSKKHAKSRADSAVSFSPVSLAPPPAETLNNLSCETSIIPPSALEPVSIYAILLTSNNARSISCTCSRLLGAFGPTSLLSRSIAARTGRSVLLHVVFVDADSTDDTLAVARCVLESQKYDPTVLVCSKEESSSWTSKVSLAMAAAAASATAANSTSKDNESSDSLSDYVILIDACANDTETLDFDNVVSGLLKSMFTSVTVPGSALSRALSPSTVAFFPDSSLVACNPYSLSAESREANVVVQAPMQEIINHAAKSLAFPLHSHHLRIVAGRWDDFARVGSVVESRVLDDQLDKSTFSGDGRAYEDDGWWIVAKTVEDAGCCWVAC